MTLKETPSHSELLALTTEIISAHVANNVVESKDIPSMIQEIYQTLSSVDKVAQDNIKNTRPEPAVSIRKSITPDYLICLEDGKKLKMLKRYLKAKYNMTPAEYRQKWGLPIDYPMTAPSYSEKRSHLAKDSGLGKK